MRLRTVTSDVLFTVSALMGVVGIHKYVFGNFPKLWLVRDWPWEYVNPWVACSAALLLAVAAARLARSPARQQTLGTPAIPSVAGVLPRVADPLPGRPDGQREASSARRN
jgi:hypothetical protein